MKRLLLLTSFALCVTALQAQVTKQLPSGIKYKIVKAGTGKKSPKIGDYIVCKLRATCSGVELMSTKKMNKGQDLPVNFTVTKPQFRGDVVEALMYLKEGDSAVIYVPQDSFFRGQTLKPKNLKPGDQVIYVIKVMGVLTKAEFDKQQELNRKALAQQRKMQADIAKQQAAQKKAAAAAKAQVKKDDAAIIAYCNANGITNYKKTNSGMYYVMTKEGDGTRANMGDEVLANYHGTLLDGKAFDSNIDSAFGHVTPQSFAVGQRRILAGLDEAFGQILTKGAKATLLIPSGLAFGPQSQGPNIPANSVVRYDVELLDIKAKKDPALVAAEEDQAIQEYIRKNNIQGAQKTASGLWYAITKPGVGTNPVKGDNLTVDYRGKLLDGTAFDSNLDSAFGHVGEFGFLLGMGQVIPGWEEGIALLNRGASAVLLIPSRLGYGEQGMPGRIPPNSPLVFEVSLPKFETPPPPPPGMRN
ncbi:MAG: hypothetical protein RL660_3085 [Bacteroidota bacterium]|jgi:FKBP-type peptidyl-prolyl cis-trans isomerase